MGRTRRDLPGTGHRFYETLHALLREAAFDRQAEALCAPYYETAHVPGRKSVAPGVYFRMHLVGFFVFEGIESERVERTCAPVCETGGARRTRLRGQANVEKRFLLQTAGANLALGMRTLFGVGTPRG